MKKINKKNVAKIGVSALMAGTMLMQAVPASAHGWIVNDRAHLSSANGGRLNRNMGNIAYEPQSAGEIGRRVVENGVVSLNDAVSANGGNIGGFPAMREFGANRFHRVQKVGGTTDINWWFTAPHRTSTIVYYVSNENFNPNEPLDFADFDYVATFNYHGQAPSATGRLHRHTINLPTNRTGAGAILAAWHVADNNVSWYRIMDVNFTGGGTITTPPTPPTTPEVTDPVAPQPEVANTWNPNAVYVGGDEVIYGGNIWRAAYWNTNVRPGTTGQWGAWRLVGPATTTPAPEVTEPEVTIPEVTEPEVTEPEVTIPEVTEPEVTEPEVTEPVAPVLPNLEQWSASRIYTAGMRVQFEGREFEALWWTQGVRPDSLNGWRLVSNGSQGNLTLTWNSNTAYVGGTVVTHNGVQWRAAWWTRGEAPGTASVWVRV